MIALMTHLMIFTNSMRQWKGRSGIGVSDVGAHDHGLYVHNKRL